MLNVQLQLCEMGNTCWSDFVQEIRAAADNKNSKELYNIIKEAFDPMTSRL